MSRAFILLFCGIAAGLVANQIKAGINNTVKEAEKRHKVENLFGQQISMEIAEKMLENDGMMESKRMNVAICLSTSVISRCLLPAKSRKRSFSIRMHFSK